MLARVFTMNKFFKFRKLATFYLKKKKELIDKII